VSTSERAVLGRRLRTGEREVYSCPSEAKHGLRSFYAQRWGIATSRVRGYEWQSRTQKNVSTGLEGSQHNLANVILPCIYPPMCRIFDSSCISAMNAWLSTRGSTSAWSASCDCGLPYIIICVTCKNDEPKEQIFDT
jgi:hypothetical protein